MFDRCGNQWTYHPVSGLPTGLRAEAIESAMRMQNISKNDQPLLFDQLLTLSGAMIKEISKEAAKQQDKQ